MRLKYLGLSRRLVGPYVWNGKNAVADVADAGLAALLLTQPDEAFEIADDEPLLAVVTADEAGVLALNGIASCEALAAAPVEDVAAALEISQAQARKRIRKAATAVKELVGGVETGVGSAGETEMTAAEE